MHLLPLISIWRLERLGRKEKLKTVCSELKVGAGGKEETISCFHSTLGRLSGEKSQGAPCRHSVDFLINLRHGRFVTVQKRLTPACFGD